MAALPAAANENIATANDHARPGTDAQDFVRANRIHVQHGSLFIDPYLVIHPRELDPTNEATLREKMRLTYSIDNPSFYESPERIAIALNLGQLVPVSLNAKRSKLMEEVKSFNTQVDSGTDAALQQQANDKHHPFSAIVRDTVEHPDGDPVGVELLKNGLSIYLLLRQKLTENHFLNRLTEYVNRSGTPDQVLQDLAVQAGTTPLAVREAALQGGLDGVGKLLGLDPGYVEDVKKVTEYASKHDFGYNVVEHWHLGRQLNPSASFEEKIATGMEARITHKIAEYRGRVRHYYDAPDPIRLEEQRIANEDMSVLEPIQRQLIFALGYEICHTPESTAGNIAFHKNIYGLHRKAANDLTDIDGTYRIYYAGHNNREKSTGTLAHEVAHNLWPSHFSKEQAATIDKLATSDQQRFASLSKLMGEKFTEFDRLHKAYIVGNPQEKAAVIAAANEQFKAYGITVDGLFPHLTNATSFRFLVWDANDVLQVEGARYNKSGYDTPQERFREIISRYAEMRQVSRCDEPNVLKFVAPGLTAVWEDHYIPHLERVYEEVVQHKAQKQAQANSAKAGVAMADNVVPLPNQAANENELPKVRERTDDETQPKVEERVTPTPHAPPIKANASASAQPQNLVDKGTIEHNAQTLAAMDALHSMGVNPRY